ncbi:MAG: type II secretion system protein [Chloroflexi bacterium]|nr:type II secretion system protein [Chloroflexota bacterium]
MMVFRKLLSILRAQGGFTLIELLVGIAITGSISGVLVLGILQTDRTVSVNRNHLVSISRVHNTGFWIQTDAQMAQSVVVGDDESGLPLTLSWTEWDNTQHQIIYAIEGNSLVRTHTADGETTSTILVAQSVDTASDMTNCEFSNGMLMFKITATEGEGPRESSETRLFEVALRAN